MGEAQFAKIVCTSAGSEAQRLGIKGAEKRLINNLSLYAVDIAVRNGLSSPQLYLTVKVEVRVS